MALSGTLNSSDYKGRYLQLTWSAKQDIENNKSTISWTLKSVGESEWSMYKAGAFKVVIDGATVYSTQESDRITIEDGTVIASGTKVLTHKADGSRSFTAHIEGGIYLYAVNCTGSTTFTLNQIPRASSFTVSNSSPNMGNAVTFTITRASSSFTHKLTLTWGGKTSTIATNVATSTDWPVPLSLANDLPNSTSSGCYITCITYNGSTEVGRKQISMTLKVPSSVKPSISSVTISEAVSGLASKFGAYIQNKSKLKVVTAASGAYSSTIKTYSVKILGKTYTGSTITSGFLTSSGSVSVVVTVTDSRKRTASTTKTVTVSAYSEPKITTFTAQRCDKNGTLNDEGEYVKLTYAFSVTSLNSKNDKSYTISYKLKTATSYTTLKTDTVYSANTTLIPTTVFGGNNSYDFKITVTDYFNTSSNPITRAAEVGTAFVLMDFHSSGSGMAIGKVATIENRLDIGLKTSYTNEVMFKNNTYAFQAEAFNGAKGYNLLAVITFTGVNVNAPIVFEIIMRRSNCPMRVYVSFEASSDNYDPNLSSITYEGANYGAFLVKSATSTWKLYVDDTIGWGNPCLHKWYTSGNQKARLSVTFQDEKIEGTDPSVLGAYYRATPVKSDSLLDHIFPVGSIYWSYTHTSPASLFGGTWTRIQNAFLWASDSSGTIGGTGGEKTHTLTVNEMPSHKHDFGNMPLSYSVRDTAGNDAIDPGSTGSVSRVTYQTVATGGGAAHNNMPPYIQVSAWRRTA